MNNKCGSIRQRSNGTWESRIMVDGKTKSFYGKTKTEVKRLLVAFLTSQQHKDSSQVDQTIADQTPVPSEETESRTVAQWFEEWQKSWISNITNNARRRYELDIRLHIIPYIGNLKLDKLTPNNIQQLYNKMTQMGLAPKSIRCLHGVIHSALDKAVQLNLLEKNASESCVLPKIRNNEMHPLKDDYVSLFLSRIEHSKYRDAFYTALFTGIREGELMGLTWDCIDFDRGTILIYRQLQRTHNHGLYEFTQTKNNKSRIIIPAKSVMDCLHSVYVRQKEIHSANEHWNVDGFVFTTDKGTHMTVNTLYKPFKLIVAAMGIPETRFHDLRHSYAVLCLQSGTDIKTLSANLGHATVAFTLDRYGHVSDTMQRQSSTLMEALITRL